MEVIGLTGGVGSGKSTVTGILRELGVPVLDADEAARAVVEPGTPGFDRVVEAFGPEVVRDGRLDRDRLGQIVFADAGDRERLQAITHPLVREWMAARQLEAERRGEELVVQDVPLIYESGLQQLYSAVIVVYVPEQLQLRRLVEGRGLSPDRARAVIAAQAPIEEKRRLADYIIDNSGTREQTRAQVESLWAEISGRSPRRRPRPRPR